VHSAKKISVSRVDDSEPHQFATFRERLLDYVVRGRPGGLLQFSKGDHCSRGKLIECQQCIHVSGVSVGNGSVIARETVCDVTNVWCLLQEWFVSVVSDLCCRFRVERRHCVQLLQRLDYTSILNIIMHKVVYIKPCTSLSP